MGSVLCAAEMVTLPTVTILYTVCMGAIHSPSWEDVGHKGVLPVGAAVVHPNTKKDFYFCRVKEGSAHTIGHLEAGKTYCATLKKGAVSCDLKVFSGDASEDSDCYLGQSVYSDGICHEDLGYITPSHSEITMADRNGLEVNTCFAYLFLVEQ